MTVPVRRSAPRQQNTKHGPGPNASNENLEHCYFRRFFSAGKRTGTDPRAGKCTTLTVVSAIGFYEYCGGDIGIIVPTLSIDWSNRPA